MHRTRGKLTYSNVISTLCLVLLLGGGTAYAASQLEKESVGASQLKKGAVTPAKLSKASKKTLTGTTGAKGATGLAGPQGIQGSKGDRGEDGPGGPGAITIEDTATTATHILGTYSGVELTDRCTGGLATLGLQSGPGSGGLTAFGTTTTGSTVSPEFGEGLGAMEKGSSTFEQFDLSARTPTVTKAFSHFDVRIAAGTCKLVGTIIPG